MFVIPILFNVFVIQLMNSFLLFVFFLFPNCMLHARVYHFLMMKILQNISLFVSACTTLLGICLIPVIWRYLMWILKLREVFLKIFIWNFSSLFFVRSVVSSKLPLITSDPASLAYNNIGVI